MSLVSEIKNWIHQHQIHTQLARFLIIGGIATIISYSIFLICLHALKINYLFASVLGSFIGIAFGYPLNKCWTFKSHASKKFHHYFAVYIFSISVSLICLKIFVDYVGIIPEISNILCIGISTCINFVCTKFLVFKA